MTDNMNGGDRHSLRRVLWGVVLIAAGCLFLLDRMDIYEAADLWRFWPIVLAVAGLIEAVTARDLSDIMHGVRNIVTGVWLYVCIENIGGLTFGNSWPILMIAFGISVFVKGIAAHNRKSDPQVQQ